jgi:hypothetical protein
MGVDCREQRRLDAGQPSAFDQIADDLIRLDGYVV